MAAGASLVETVDLLAEEVLPQLGLAPTHKTFEEQFFSADWDAVDDTTYVTGVPGYSLFDNLYAYRGALYAVTSSPSSLPEVSRVLSRVEGHPAGPEGWQVISRSEAQAIFGSRIVRLRGDTMFFADGPPTSFLDHYYHFLIEIFSGAWRLLASTAARERQPLIPGPPERIIFARAEQWRDGPGLNSWFLQTVLPGAHIEDRFGWADRAASEHVYRFDRIVIADRWAAHRHSAKVNHWNKMNADVYDHVPAADNWWEPIRSALMLALDVPDEPMSPEPVLTYVNRQGTSRRRLSDASHQSLMDALYEIEGEGIAQVYDARMELLPKNEQLGLSSRTDILLGVHGNGLSHLMWMPRGSHVVEIFADGGFTRDYEMLTASLGHHHYAVWEDKVYLEREWKRAAPEFETAGTTGIDFQGTEIGVDGAFIKRLVQDIIDNDGRNYRST